MNILATFPHVFITEVFVPTIGETRLRTGRMFIETVIKTVGKPF